MFSGENHITNGIKYININLFNMNGEADEYIIQDFFGKFETNEAYEMLANKLEKYIDVSEYDVLQLNSQLFLKAWSWKKRIFTIHTNPFEYILAWGEKSYKKMIKLMSELKDNSNTIFVAPSKFYANEYNELTKCDIHYIPHAIDITRIETFDTKEKILKKYGINNKKKKIIVPSRLEPIQKQPMLLIEACCLLEETEKEKIQIIYTGLDRQYIKFVDELMDKAKSNNLDVKIVRFDEMAEAYKIADLTVLPSRSESFGYSALESLTFGIKTFLNNIPTFNEIADGCYYCEIFDNSALELKEKISDFIKNDVGKQRFEPNVAWKEKYELDNFAKTYMKEMN